MGLQKGFYEKIGISPTQTAILEKAMGLTMPEKEPTFRETRQWWAYLSCLPVHKLSLVRSRFDSDLTNSAPIKHTLFRH